MKILLQTDSVLTIEYQIIKEILEQTNPLHQVKEIDYQTLKQLNEIDKNFIPIGTIEFVNCYMDLAYDRKQQNPIEIPIYLRTQDFLKRDYKIVEYKDIPKTGQYFVKDVSQLKTFEQIINVDELNDYNLDETHLFQVSECFDIKSEYRVYVIDGKIENIVNYNGDVTLSPDINLIKKAVNLINFHEKWLNSYTIDIMVGDKGTAIIEIHNFISVGLYHNLWGHSLIYAYRDGIEYLLNDNKNISKDTLI